MGTSVATELLARDLEGALEMNVAGVLLFNGSMVQGAASPTLAQRILRSPLGPLFSRLSSERFFRAQFGSVFSPGHPLSDEEAEDQWSLICAGGGRTLNHKTIRYMDERFRHAERWHGALRDWPGPLQLAWGMLDPVATIKVLDAVRALRPRAPLTELPHLGHYPQIEDPERLDTVLRAALDA
jgi:pimeloyl-ACP methyl ester carboxylesterase